MHTRSSSNLVGNSSSNPTTSNPKRRNRRRSKQPFSLEESPIVTMADQRTMAELLRAPTEGYAEAIVVPPILAEHFELKHSLINMMTSDQFFRLEKDNPHDHIPRRWLEKEPPRSILTWEDLVSKFINEFFPPSRTTNLRNEISNFEQLKSSDVNSSIPLVFAYLLIAETSQTSVVTTAMTAILKQFQATPPPASVKAVEEICVTCGGAHPYYQCLAADGNTFPEYRDNIQGYVSAAAGNYNQGNSGYRPPGVANQTRPPGLAQPNVQNNQNRFSQPQGYNRGNNFNQNANYQAPIQQNQSVPLSELEKIKKMNDVNIKAMQAQINNVKNELRNEMQTSIQASMSNQTNELKNMMASFFQMNTASTLGTGSLPSNTVANPKGELKAITTRSGLVLDGPSVSIPPPFINPEEDERVEETLTDPEHSEFTIKVPPPLIQKAKPPSQINYVVHQRDPRHPHIPYPSRMNQEKQKEKDEVQIHKFWQMFKQLHINIILADALILILKYQKILKSLLSNKEKLLELANTPLNENCSAVILKKLPEKLGDPGKFLISCSFSELKCKALADLGDSINLMPLSVWKKLGLSELISTQMTLELANREICTPVGIARDVFVPVGKFTFPVDFVIVDYESDPRVLLILGRPFLRTARALIDVHGEEMILCNGNERLTLNMRHDTSSYSTQPHQESIYIIDVYNVSHEEILEDLFVTNHPSGNPTSSLTSHTDLTSLEVNDDILDPEGDIIENLLNLDKTKDLPPYHDNPLKFEAYLASDSFPLGNSNPSSPLPHFHNSLSGSTTSSSPSLPISKTSNYSLEEFVDELALITCPLGIDYLPFDAESNLREIEYLLNHDPIKEMDYILEDSIDKNSPDDNLVDTISEMFTDEHALDYSSPPLWDDYNDELFDLETDLDPPLSLYELPFHKEVPGLGALLSFSSKNEEKVFNPGILTSKRVHYLIFSRKTYSLGKSKAFKIAPDYEASRARGFVLRSLELQHPQLHYGNPISNLID
ncbi:reverse transcriptase domain-containing protein [Tanacetum coccineum]|uniref:Reverse transcriptase domain-containing protein n=1 Tax=Tanacetum coccineum TaxID=301880 RepID=A0ABQ5FZ68_9ASTR